MATNLLPNWIIVVTAYLSFTGGITQESMNLLLDSVIAQINAGESEVHIQMSSGGGFVDPCLHAYNTLRALPVNLTTHNVGALQSMANVLFLAGNTRLAAPHTTFLFHRTTYTFPDKMMDLDARRLREFADACDLSDRRLYRILSADTGMTIDRARSLVQRGTSLDPETAKKRGVVHEIRAPDVPLGSTFVQVR